MIPNLALTPNPAGPTLDTLIAGMKKGLAILGGGADTDFQAKNGTLTGNVYEVKDGKRVARVANAAVLFSSAELWKNVTAIGGAASVTEVASGESKGQPGQGTVHTVSGVALTLKQQAVIDITRRA
jgi:predicted Zn-dependent protease